MFDQFNLNGSGYVDLYSLMHMLWHDPNLTHNIIASNFLHDLRTWHEPNIKLEIMVENVDSYN